MTEKMSEKTQAEASKDVISAEKKALQEEFMKTVESKIHKEEKHVWFFKDKDHLNG